MIKFQIIETDQDELLTDFFKSLEVTPSAGPDSDREVIQAWIIVNGDDKSIAGGAVLAKIDGYFVVDGIAMAREYQRIKLGKELMMMLIEKALQNDAEAIWLASKYTGFFQHIGLKLAEPGEGPDFLKEKCKEQDEEGRTSKILKLQMK